MIRTKKVPESVEPEFNPIVTCMQSRGIHSDLFLAFCKWIESADTEILENEVMVASAKHKYAGSLDAVGRKDGKLIVLDWKTSNSIKSTYALQVAAYAKAYEETSGNRIDEGESLLITLFWISRVMLVCLYVCLWCVMPMTM